MVLRRKGYSRRWSHPLIGCDKKQNDAVHQQANNRPTTGQQQARIIRQIAGTREDESMMRCGDVRCGGVRCGAVRCCAVRTELIDDDVEVDVLLAPITRAVLVPRIGALGMRR
jgi:hypothetical protein